MSTYQQQAASEIPIACCLAGPEVALRRAELATGMFKAVQQVQELENGYAFQFPGNKDWAEKLLNFIVFERECCPFFTFELTFEPDKGSIWLRLCGNDEVKAFVQAGFLSAK
jgi:hypothetical protein